MAEASLNSSGETPVKSSASSSYGCLFCGTQQTDSRIRISLKGKVQDLALLAERVAIVLDISTNQKFACSIWAGKLLIGGNQQCLVLESSRLFGDERGLISRTAAGNRA